MTGATLPEGYQLLNSLTALRLLDEVVADATPNYRYWTTGHPGHEGRDELEGVCRYVYDGEADCGVARVLHRYGVPIDVLRRWEGYYASEMGPAGSPGRRHIPTTGPLVTDEAALILKKFQRSQDNDTPWGKALGAALEEARALRVIPA